MAKNALTYNLPAKIALETVDVLKRCAYICLPVYAHVPRLTGSVVWSWTRYGLTGFTGLLLRKDFIESVEMLKQISGMVSGHLLPARRILV